MELHDTLIVRFELFRSVGRYFKHSAQELIAEASWLQVLICQGFEMHSDPVTEFVADEELASFLRDIAEVIEDVALKMPDHGEFVHSLPPSTEAAQSQQQVPAVTPKLNFALRYERGETTA